jgi:hypothetical protein
MAWAAPLKPGQVSSAVTETKAGDLVPKAVDGKLVLYVDGQQSAALGQAVAKVGGTVSATRGDRVEAVVPAGKVAALAKEPGVAAIRNPDRGVPMGAIDPEGVAASGADAWLANGKTGAGVKVGIIDAGYGGLQDAQDAGALPPTGPQLAVNNSTCQAANQPTDHGISVAEVVHAMAPDAQLFLVCAGNSMEFTPAANWLQQQGVQVITSALGFFTSGRGDGTGATDTPADVVSRTSKAGILWSVAAGNQAREHYVGKAATAADGFVKFGGTASEGNGVSLGANVLGTFGLRWDAWPKTNQELDLYVMKAQHPPTGPSDPDIVAQVANHQSSIAGGGEPTAEATIQNGPAGQLYYVYVKNVNAVQTTNLELFVSGGGQNNQFLQFSTAAGSITEPATSPYAVAVGATQPNSGTIEPDSSRGPTIDGRMKPDITGYDQVSTSNAPGGRFIGTSAAAAHVGGAVALLKSASPGLDASQLRAALVARANPKKADNDWGAGPLKLGDPTQPPTVTGLGYTALATATRLSGPSKPYNAGESYVAPLNSAIPSDAKAVVVTMTARTNPQSGAADVPTAIDAYPNDPPDPNNRATMLQVRQGQVFTSLTMILPVGDDRAIRFRDSGTGPAFLVVDLRGYFSSSGASTYFGEPSPQRVLDTRGGAALAANASTTLKLAGVAGVPTNATSVAINVTGVEASDNVSVEAWSGPTNPGTTLLSMKPADRRSGFSIVPLGSDGSITLSQIGGTGPVGVLVDVVGWFAPGDGARYVPLSQATRVADTATGTGGRTTPIGQGDVAGFQIDGVAGIPANTTAAALTATALEDSQGTELSLRASDVGFSAVTDLTTAAGLPLSNTSITSLGASGKVDVRNERGNARVALDATGYFVGGGVATASGNCVTQTNESGFTSMFDGRAESSMDGWQSTNKANIMKADGCELVSGTGNVDATWYSRHVLGNDYTVRLDWKATADNADSGVYVLMNNPGTNPNSPGSSGLEVQIGPKGATGTAATGAIVGAKAPTANAAKPTGEWNTYDITVSWNSVTVALNGQQVNQYTTPNASILSHNTFIGLQNSGGNGAVRFRNIRVKANTPVRAGTLKGANNFCLDLPNGDPNGRLVRTWDCTANAVGQNWTMTGLGTVVVAGKCLDVDGGGTANGALVQVWTCNDFGSQQWLLRQDGELLNVGSGRCLTPVSGADGAGLQLLDCTVGRADQVWTTPNQHGSLGELTGPGNRCLDLPSGDVTKATLQMYDCNGTVPQQWAVPGDGTIRDAGKCLDVFNSGTTPGTVVQLYECNGSGAQQWVRQNDGTTVNPQSALCLAANSSSQNAGLALQTCAAQPLQVWHLTAQSLWRGQILGVGSMCLDTKNADPATGVIQLSTCKNSAGQVFVAPGDGTLRTFRECLDLGNWNDGAQTLLVPCNGNKSQQWALRPNGAIVSVFTGKVVDDFNANTTDGNYVQAYAWNGNPPQLWATPLLPS